MLSKKYFDFQSSFQPFTYLQLNLFYTRISPLNCCDIVANYFIHEKAVVENGAVIGDHSKIWHFSHIRETAILGTNVIIGKNVYVDINVVIGSNVKIQNNVSVYSGVTIEDDVFIGPHAVFTNDLNPRSKGEWEIMETRVKRGTSIGANSVIICGNTLGSHCMVGAGSVVTKSVPAHALVFGNPARFRGIVCFCGEKVAGEEAQDGIYTCSQCNETFSFSPNNFE